jgi:hypothetical protein
MMHLKYFRNEIKTEILHLLICNQPSSENDTTAAEEIYHLFNGLSLTIIQINKFIHDRNYSYEKFLAIYKKSAEKIFAKSESSVEYNYILNII